MDERRPELPFDPKHIKKMRRELQKPYDKEAMEAWLFHRRISIYITNFLIPYEYITPNNLTLIAILLGIFGTFSIWVTPEYARIWIVLIFYNLAYLLDTVDGELARARKQFSDVGIWLDAILSAVLGVLSTAAGLSYMLDLNWKHLIPVILLPIPIRFSARSKYEFLRPTTQGAPLSDIKTKNWSLSLLSMMSTPGGFLIWLALGEVLKAKAIMLTIGLLLLWLSTLYQIYRFWVELTVSGANKKGINNGNRN